MTDNPPRWAPPADGRHVLAPAPPTAKLDVARLESRDCSPDEHVEERRDVLAPLASADRDAGTQSLSGRTADGTQPADASPPTAGAPPVSSPDKDSRRISFHLYDKPGAGGKRDSLADSQSAVDDEEHPAELVEPPFARSMPVGRSLRRLVSAPAVDTPARAGAAGLRPSRLRTVSEGDVAVSRPPSHAATVPAFGNVADLKASAEDVIDRFSPRVLPKQRRVQKYYKKQEEVQKNWEEDEKTVLAYEHKRVNSVARSMGEPAGRQKSGGSTGAAAGDEKVKDEGRQQSPVDDDERMLEEAVMTAIEQSDLGEKKSGAAKVHAKRMAQLSFAVNVLLLAAKLTATVMSGSYSIISSLVDSIVDLTSGAVIWYTERAIRKRDPYEYPRGRTRLEPLALVVISVVMAVASIQVIVQSAEAMISGDIDLDVSPVTIALMAATVASKFVLMLLCRRAAAAAAGDPSCTVLAQDHRNDCISNSVAVACAIAGDRLWSYADPIGAIVVSLYIVGTWFNTGYEQIVMLSGKSAPPDLINRIIRVCLMHDPRVLSIDTVYVYHFGSKFLVEVHIVLDGEMTLRESHDLSEPLQNKLEALDWVERAFVHTDYDTEHRPEDEHKVV